MRIIHSSFPGLVLLALLISSGCALPSGHENFKTIMNNHVGKRADDPSTDTARYRARRIEVRTLENGNAEEGYPGLRSCRYYFEIDKTTETIVNWRFEGTVDDCVIPL
jgi:hypothetical protein